MSEGLFYNVTFSIFLLLPVIVFLGLVFGKVKAPYGRYTTPSWGPVIPAKWGWIIMEAPSSILFLVFFLLAPSLTPGQIALFFIWQFHYFYRSFIYPFLSQHSKGMAVVLMLSALTFQVFNTYFQARWIYKFAPPDFYGSGYLASWQFILGLGIFLLGTFINRQSDAILRRLRSSSGDKSYKIPYGGLFRWVSCPNYLGEIIIWLGWAVMLKSWVGFAFFLWTVSNLVPRAMMNHQWYLERFPDYPKDRKILIPYIF